MLCVELGTNNQYCSLLACIENEEVQLEKVFDLSWSKTCVNWLHTKLLKDTSGCKAKKHIIIFLTNIDVGDCKGDIVRGSLDCYGICVIMCTMDVEETMP